MTSRPQPDESLPDRQFFPLSSQQWEVFEQALDAPTPPAPRLAKLLEEPSVFEQSDLWDAR